MLPCAQVPFRKFNVHTMLFLTKKVRNMVFNILDGVNVWIALFACTESHAAPCDTRREFFESMFFEFFVAFVVEKFSVIRGILPDLSYNKFFCSKIIEQWPTFTPQYVFMISEHF